MLPLDDARWPKLLSGRRTACDASSALRAMESGSDVWDQLWDELYHQGDVDEAAYAALPHLVRINAKRSRDWNLYALAATIEIERYREGNPPLPEWALGPYTEAWAALRDLALADLAAPADPLLVQSALSVLAIAHGQRELGALLWHMDATEITEFVEERLTWSGLYV